jgi:hypothetical protein
MFTRASDRSIVIFTRHPATSQTWHWSVGWRPYRGDERRRWLGYTRQGERQVHRNLHLLKLGRLTLSTQDYHKA